LARNELELSFVLLRGPWVIGLLNEAFPEVGGVAKRVVQHSGYGPNLP
jgi:hypothetical protein